MTISQILLLAYVLLPFFLWEHGFAKVVCWAYDARKHRNTPSLLMIWLYLWPISLPIGAIIQFRCRFQRDKQLRLSQDNEAKVLQAMKTEYR